MKNIIGIIALGGLAYLIYKSFSGGMKQPEKQLSGNYQPVTPVVVAPPVVTEPTTITTYDVNMTPPEMPNIPDTLTINTPNITPTPQPTHQPTPQINIQPVKELLKEPTTPNIKEVVSRAPSTGIEILDKVRWGGFE